MKRILLLSSIVSCLGFSAGYEQLTMWSGKYTGEASAVTSEVSGPESLYFNPAGLAWSGAHDLSGNLSYFRSQFKEPWLGNDQTASKWGNNISGSVLYSSQATDKLAWGVGFFPSAGLDITYGEKDLGGGFMGAPKTQLAIYELSGGAAYKITPEFSVGAGYRITYATAAFNVVQNGGPLGTIVGSFKDLKAMDFLSARVGAQYKVENWGIGLNVRTPVRYKLKGKADVGTAASVGQSEDSSAYVTTTFPLAVSLGGHYNMNNWTFLLDYSWLNYSADKQLQVDANVGGLIGAVPNIDQKWHDSHVIRLGADWKANDKWNFRGGAIMKTTIVNKDHALPNTEPPGTGFLFTLGTGYSVAKDLSVDGSVFYGWDSGKANQVAGDYKLTGYGVHTGVTYSF